MSKVGGVGVPFLHVCVGGRVVALTRWRVCGMGRCTQVHRSEAPSDGRDATPLF